jgi:hypothetical protein
MSPFCARKPCSKQSDQRTIKNATTLTLTKGQTLRPHGCGLLRECRRTNGLRVPANPPNQATRELAIDHSDYVDFCVTNVDFCEDMVASNQ